MNTLIATPLWVLVFGVINLILTIVNCVLVTVLLRLLGPRVIDEIAKRSADEIKHAAVRPDPLPPLDMPASVMCGCELREPSENEFCSKCGGYL